MTRRLYLAEALRLYLQAPDTPARPTRSDWAIAGDLYRRGASLDHLAHAIRLATLRRRLRHPPRDDTVHSLAYYRALLLALTDDQLDPAYVNYIRYRCRELLAGQIVDSEPRAHSQNPALSGSR